MERGVVVVGAGLAGLTAARSLTAAGVGVVVVDKGRGVGGRLATRRIGPATFDHGATEIDLRPPAGWPLDTLRRAGDGRWRGVPTMTAIPKALAVGLDLRLGRAVTAVVPDPGGWQVRFGEAGADTPPATPIPAAGVVLTAPVPQALALLDGGGVDLAPDLRAALGAVRYRPAAVALVPLQAPARTPGSEGAVVADDPVVARIVDHQRRGTSAVPAVTVVATESWSADHLEEPPDVAAQALLAGARRRGIRLDPLDEAVQLHRWRYARVAAGMAAPAVAIDPGSLVLAGDAFGPGDAAGAVASGHAAAQALLGHLGRA